MIIIISIYRWRNFPQILYLVSKGARIQFPTIWLQGLNHQLFSKSCQINSITTSILTTWSFSSLTSKWLYLFLKLHYSSVGIHNLLFAPCSCWSFKNVYLRFFSCNCVWCLFLFSSYFLPSCLSLIKYYWILHFGK